VPQNGSIPVPVGGLSQEWSCLAAGEAEPERRSDRLARAPDVVPRAPTAFLPALADCLPLATRFLLK
jgi:hypothetical protein